MSRYGYHWTPCDRGSGGGRRGGGAAIAVLVIVAVVAASAKPVVHAAETALEIAAIVAGSVLGAVVLVGATWAALRVARWRAGTRALVSRDARQGQALTEAHRVAIEAPPPVAYQITDVQERSVEHR